MAAHAMVPALRLAKNALIFDGFFGGFCPIAGAGYAPGATYGLRYGGCGYCPAVYLLGCSVARASAGTPEPVVFPVVPVRAAVAAPAAAPVMPVAPSVV